MAFSPGNDVSPHYSQRMVPPDSSQQNRADKTLALSPTYAQGIRFVSHRGRVVEHGKTRRFILPASLLLTISLCTRILYVSEEELAFSLNKLELAFSLNKPHVQHGQNLPFPTYTRPREVNYDGQEEEGRGLYQWYHSENHLPSCCDLQSINYTTS